MGTEATSGSLPPEAGDEEQLEHNIDDDKQHPNNVHDATTGQVLQGESGAEASKE